MLIAAWSNFLGANTMIHPKRLAEGLGVDAANIRRGFADFRPLNAAQTVVTTGGATPILSAWRWGRSSASDTSGWVQWTVDVDVVRSLIATDPAEEIHYTGDGAPKTTDTAIGLPAGPGPASARTLGIPKPPTAMGSPTILVAGSGSTEYRVYVDTFVNDKDRESAPGTAVSVSCNAGSTMTLPSLSSVPSGLHGITLRRIYVSTDGGDFMRCAEVLATATSATDTGTRGAILQSGGDDSKPAWLEPPSGLKGLISLWNSMLGGFVGKRYYVCEPGKAWAWPIEYGDTLPDDIVASGKWRQNWVLLTNAQPYIVRGSGPLNMGWEPVPFMQSCVSKRSALSLGHGVVWAGPSGLCYVGTNGTSILTEGVFSPEQWQAMAPSTMVCNRWERYVLCFFDNGTSTKGFMIDPLAPAQGVIFLTQGANGTFYDPISDRLYLLDTGNTIKRWHNGTPMLARWKSNVVRNRVPTAVAFGLVVADEPIEVTVTLWANVLQADGSRAWTQVFSRTVLSGQPFTLEGGYDAQDFQAQIEADGPVQALMLAEDVDDLP